MPAVDVDRRNSAAWMPAPSNPRSYAFAFWLLHLIFDRYLTTHITGQANVPPPGVPTIVTANHTSALDLFAAGHALQRPGYFVAKVEATRIPLFGRFMLSVGAIPARRDERDTAVLRQLIAVLDGGGMTGVAPEGTRSLDGRLKRYDPGFVWLAVRTGATVVPCAIHGTYQLMPKGARFPRRGHVWLRFGEPMSFTRLAGRPSRSQLEAWAEEIRQRTLTMLADLAAESGIPNPALEETR
jgi:1-acyl-sn-glycerol-3-phosphate acyltransferase